MASKLHSIKTASGSKFVGSISLGDVTVHKWNQQKSIETALQDLQNVHYIIENTGKRVPNICWQRLQINHVVK